MEPHCTRGKRALRKRATAEEIWPGVLDHAAVAIPELRLFRKALSKRLVRRGPLGTGASTSGSRDAPLQIEPWDITQPHQQSRLLSTVWAGRKDVRLNLQKHEHVDCARCTSFARLHRTICWWVEVVVEACCHRSGLKRVAQKHIALSHHDGMRPEVHHGVPCFPQLA